MEQVHDQEPVEAAEEQAAPEAQGEAQGGDGGDNVIEALLTRLEATVAARAQQPDPDPAPEEEKGEAADASAEVEALRAELAAIRQEQQVGRWRSAALAAEGLPVEALDFIGGGTEEEVKARAKALKRLLAPPAQSVLTRGQLSEGPGREAPRRETSKERALRIRRESGM